MKVARPVLRGAGRSNAPGLPGVTGPANGRVRVGFTGRLKGRIVASASKTVPLKHGHLTVTFKLGPRTAAHALIRVSAKLDHEAVVTSTLHRRHRPAR